VAITCPTCGFELAPILSSRMRCNDCGASVTVSANRPGLLRVAALGLIAAGLAGFDDLYWMLVGLRQLLETASRITPDTAWSFRLETGRLALAAVSGVALVVAGFSLLRRQTLGMLGVACLCGVMAVRFALELAHWFFLWYVIRR